MGTADGTGWDRAWTTDGGRLVEEVLDAAARAVGRVVRWVGFWTAVTLPLAYVYLLAWGLSTAEAITLAKLLGLHLVAFVAGRSYKVGAAGRASAGDRNGSV